MTTNRRAFMAGLTAAGAACALSRVPAALADDQREAPSESSTPAAAALAADPRRPQFHLLPARNWMNDPNGPIYWHGKYHMFCQYNPHAAVWGDMHWYHSVSPDMVHWQHLPIGLAPTPGGPDADGCFTGSAVDDNGVATIIYTGIQASPADVATLHDPKKNFRESQLLATSTDPELRTWTKLPAPVVPAPPAGLKVTGFRDPCPWRGEDGHWYLNVGSGVAGQGGMVLLYRSRDLRHWEYLHPLLEGKMTGKHSDSDPVGSGEMWECPDFFKLGDRYVLIYSTEGKVYWQTGQLHDLRFVPEQTGLLDHGAYYAPKTQTDAHGNRILWGWIPERRPEAEYSAAGWAGLMSLPRVLTLDNDKRLHMEVLPAVRGLRGPRISGSGSAPEPLRFANAAAEVRCALKPGGAASLVFKSGEQQWLTIEYDGASNRVRFDNTEAQLPAKAAQPEISAFVDGSVIEVLVDAHIAFTKRFYFPGSTAPEIEVAIEGDPRSVEHLELWPMKPISKDRLTS
jgi:beta-fructofuranosidase